MLIFLQKNNVGSDTVVCHPNIYYRAKTKGPIRVLFLYPKGPKENP